MPKILINEIDNTKPGRPADYSNHAVLIPGFKGEPVKGAGTEVQPDSNGVYEFKSAGDFEATIGLTKDTNGSQTDEKVYSFDGFDVSAVHYGNRMAYELLLLGYEVIYLPIEDVTELTKETTWELFKDKASYDFRFVTHGLLESNTKPAQSNAVETAIEELKSVKNYLLEIVNAITDGITIKDLTTDKDATALYKADAVENFYDKLLDYLKDKAIEPEDPDIGLMPNEANKLVLKKYLIVDNNSTNPDNRYSNKYDYFVDVVVGIKDDKDAVATCGIVDKLAKLEALLDKEVKSGIEYVAELDANENAVPERGELILDNNKAKYQINGKDADSTFVFKSHKYPNNVKVYVKTTSADGTTVTKEWVQVKYKIEDAGTIALANAQIANLAKYVAAGANNTNDMTTTELAGRGDCVALIEIDECEYKAAVCNPERPIIAAINKMSGINAENGKFCALTVPSVVYTTGIKMPAAFHYLACYKNSMQLGYKEWYAAAGYTRGVSSYRIDHTTVTLGEIAINALEPRNTDGSASSPKFACNVIANFRGSYYLWGNRTAHPLGDAKGTAGDLVASHFLNIRHLCSTIKKQLYVSCRRFTFDPNSDTLWFNFVNSIRPTLELMKADQGIRDYKIVKETTDKKATLKAKLRIIPIEAVEDFDLTIYLEDSFGETVATSGDIE